MCGKLVVVLPVDISKEFFRSSDCWLFPPTRLHRPSLQTPPPHPAPLLHSHRLEEIQKTQQPNQQTEQETRRRLTTHLIPQNEKKENKKNVIA